MTDTTDPAPPGVPATTHEDLALPELVHRLHDGNLSAAALPVKLRRDCVTHLCLEGFTTSQIAQLIRISERTVRRDREVARRHQALRPSRVLGDQWLGEFERIVLASVGRLTRICNSPDTPPAVRVEAERQLVQSYHCLLVTAQRMCYLEDGRRRLEHQRATDPAERQRFAQRLTALMSPLAPA